MVLAACDRRPLFQGRLRRPFRLVGGNSLTQLPPFGCDAVGAAVRRAAPGVGYSLQSGDAPPLATCSLPKLLPLEASPSGTLVPADRRPHEGAWVSYESSRY